LSLPDEDKHLAQSDALHAQLAGLLGGRVAEEIVFGKITSGAENDIQKATQLARRMVTQWGMSDKVGPVAMGENNELIFLGRDLGTQRNYSEEMASLIDNEVRTMIENARTQATQIITERRNNLEALAAALIADETVEGEALEHLLAFTGDPPPPPDVSPA
jgi:cell division protease FtsH